MAKKSKKVKPHLAQGGMAKAFQSTLGVDQELKRHLERPSRDGLHVVEKDGGYWMYWMERGQESFGGRFFTSKAEADKYLKTSPEVVNPKWL